jgi:uncharacterized membrane protein
MDDVTIALSIHVLAVVWWIGGVAMVTTILLPALRRVAEPEERFALFSAIERRFVWQARAATLVAGASGFYMLDRLGLWPAFRSPAYWWLWAMVGVWALFTAVLFVAEPLFLERWFAQRALHDPEGSFAFAERMHWLLLALSLVTVFGAVAGSHGLSFFG